MKECKHEEFYYYPEPCNEAGWKCADRCGEKMPGDPPGYRPDLEREPEYLYLKIDGILRDADTANLVHVSNGSEGDHLVCAVGKRCVAEGRFDQYSILLFLLEEMTPSHAGYWKEISDGVVAGRDPRRRCVEPDCGRLATVYGERDSCHEHSHELLPF